MPGFESTGEKALRVITGHPFWVVAAVLLTLVLALDRIVDLQTGEPRLVVDPSVESLLPADDASRAYFDRFEATFDLGDTIVLALEDEDVFTAANLERVSRITERVEELDEVDRVTSLSRSVNIRSEDGALVVEPFYDEVPQTAHGLADLRRRALEDPIYAGNLVSPDARVSVVIVHLLDLTDAEVQASGIDARVREIAAEEWSHAPFRTTGTAHVKTALNDVIVSDMTVIVPITWLLMAIVAYVSFRSIRSVIVTLLSIQVSVLLTIGFIAYQYETLNQVTSAVPSILFVIGLAYAIHILAAYYDALRGGLGGAEGSESPVLLALRKVTVPVLFTGFTTAAGFFSLATSPLDAIRQYGIAVGVGVLLTMGVSLTFAPALLQLLPTPRNVRRRAANEGFDRWLLALARFDVRHRNAILMAGIALALVSLVGMLRIEIGYDFVSSFKAQHPVRVDFEAINGVLEGANAFNVGLETSVTEGFKDPENLRILEDLQAWLVAQPEIGGSTSFADYVKALHQGIQGGEPAWFRVPESRELVSQLLILGENEEMDRFVDVDFQRANIEIRTTAMNSREVLPLVERIERRLADVPDHILTHVTGESVLVSRTMDSMAFGQATSMLTAFASILVILTVLFASFRTGLLALVPNVLPVLVYFGILGWAGIELNTTTGIVACLVLGIAVDDTIHLFSHFNQGARRHASEEQGVAHALLSIGRPVTSTTVALFLGFLCLMFSDMRTQFEFGWLAAATLAVAWVVDMTFTPALAARLKIVTIWDIITLDLGEEPQRSIPLFHGLTANQSRVAASMATIDSFEAGDQVFTHAEPGDFMYVVIDGELEVYRHSGDGRVHLTKLGRGAVLGEIALFNGVRSADVQALTDARLLRLTEDDLQRIHRRRPRIGARLYANLSRALAQRVVRLTERVI
jgi:predicted RND superfamily exporter protein